MNLTLSEEQQMIRASVFDYFSAAYRFEHHLTRLTQPACPQPEAWRTMGELGWLGLTVPQEHGGLGLGPQEAMLLMEGAGAALNTEPLLATAILAAPLLATHAACPAATAALDATMAGKASLALAWAEQDRGLTPLDIATHAGQQDHAWRLSGQKRLVDNGAEADWLVVSAKDGTAPVLLLVPGDAPGMTRTGAALADGSHCADIEFKDTPAVACLAIGSEAQHLLLRAIYRGLAAACAEALGAMEQALAISRDYLHARHQFGKPLAAQPVLQHRYVDMLMACERARSMTLLAAIQADHAASGDALAQRDLSLAKLTVGHSARFVGGQAIQVHGGMGMAYEYPIGHYYRKLLACDNSFGARDDHLALLAQDMPAPAPL